jgi:hypothetical protein
MRRASGFSRLMPFLFLPLSLSFFFIAPTHADDDELVDSIVEAITENEPGSDKFNKGVEDAKKLTDAQAAQVATKIVNKITGDAATSVKTLLNLYKMGMKGAPKNPLLKKLGKKLADAINNKMEDLIKVLRDPRTRGGYQALVRALQDLGISDENKVLDIVDKVMEKAIAEEEEAGEEKKKKANSKSDDTLHYNSTTSVMSFTEDYITSIFDPSDLSLDYTDTIVGAEVVIPAFLYTGITAEGEPGFENESGEAIVISKNGDIFIEFFVPYLIWTGADLFGIGTDIVLSGAPIDSPYYDAFPDLGSVYIDELNSILFPFDYRYYFHFTITPNENLASITNDFRESASIGFVNSAQLTRISEPSLFLLILSVSAYLFASRGKGVRLN